MKKKTEKPVKAMAFGERLEKTKIEDWEVSSACDALMRAEEIKRDPKMMRLVKKKLAQKKIALSMLEDEVKGKGKA